MRLPLFLVLASLVACAEFPQLDADIDAAARGAAFPDLQPLEPLIAKADAMQASARVAPASIASFDTRIARLTVRAAALRAPVITAATRARLRRGVAVPAAIR